MDPEDTTNKIKKILRGGPCDQPYYRLPHDQTMLLSSYMALGGARQGCWDDIIQPFVIT